MIEEFWIIDKSGICFFHRSINPENNVIEKNGSFTIDDGRHQLWVFAVDKAGNSYEELLDVNVDSSDPSTNIFLYGEGDSGDNRFYKDVEIRLAASDMGSGVKETFYRLDGDPMGYN